MSELVFLSLAELSARIRGREVSPVEVTRAALERLERLEPRLNAFITPLPEAALAAAREAEREIMAGGYRGPLHGVPISLKDLFWTKGIRTTAGSKILADFVPDEDCTAWTRLRAAGPILLGKTNMHEFAFGSTGENAHYGPSRNPWDAERITGGSSSGAGAEVACGISCAGLGTDTGGSVRMPASLCGIVGLKPTYGRVSRFGVVPLSWSRDHVGPLTRTVADAALVLQAIAGYDERDPASAELPVPDFSLGLADGVRGLRIGVPDGYFFDGADPEVVAAVRSAVDVLVGLGAVRERVALPAVCHALPAFSILVGSEAAAYHLPWLQTRPDDYGPDVRDRLETGAVTLAVDYLQAQRVRALVRAELAAVFERVDLLATPATPVPATKIGESDLKLNDVLGTPRNAMSRYSGPFNLTGQPAISVPCGFTRAGLPIGLQLAGRAWDEATVLRAAHAYEQATEWHRRRPPVG